MAQLRRPNNNGDSGWAIIDNAQAAVDGVPALEGGHMYKGWVNSASSSSHRAYPVVHLDQASGGGNPDFPNGVPSPMVNKFHVYMDWDSGAYPAWSWVSLFTLCNNTTWNVITGSMLSPGDLLELAHVGGYGDFDEGNGWERIGGNTYMPANEWTSFTVYADFRPEYDILYVWMNGEPILRANGGEVDQDSDYLKRAHWGLYASGQISDAVMYNDSIQLWTLTKPWTDFSTPPPSPYESQPMLGDLNDDGIIDVTDVDLLFDEIAGPDPSPAADLNDDGLVNQTDADELIRNILDSEYGDANLDGRVDAGDLSLLAARWQYCPNTWSAGDFTGNGCVGADDLSLLAANWQWQRPAGDPVPEPTVLALLAGGASALAALRRRRAG